LKVAGLLNIQCFVATYSLIKWRLRTVWSGVVGVGFNCWTDVVRSVVQKKAIAASFDPNAPKASQLEPLSPVPFFKETAALLKSKGIGGLYAGVGPKMIHLGLGNSILFLLMPRFKEMWFNSQGIALK